MSVGVCVCVCVCVCACGVLSECVCVVCMCQCQCQWMHDGSPRELFCVIWRLSSAVARPRGTFTHPIHAATQPPRRMRQAERKQTRLVYAPVRRTGVYVSAGLARLSLLDLPCSIIAAHSIFHRRRPADVALGGGDHIFVEFRRSAYPH